MKSGESLHDAIKKNYGIDRIHSLIRNGADMEERDFFGGTPLIKAVSTGSYAITSLLLREGARVNACTRHGLTPLMISENVDITELLLRNRADVKMKSFSTGETALMKLTNIEVTRLLVMWGADLEAKDVNGYTVLMKAEDPQFVKLLLEHGANTESQDSFKRTVLMQTDYNLSKAKLLIQYKANINATDRFGSSIVESTVDHEMFKLLVLYGAELNRKDHNGDSTLIPRQLMVNFDHTQNIRLAIRHGLDIHSRNKRGQKLLTSYVIKGCGENIERLVEIGFNVNERDPFGTTPLTHAARGGFVKIAETLINLGAIGDYATLEKLFSEHSDASYTEVLGRYRKKQQEKYMDTVDDEWNEPVFVAIKENNTKGLHELIDMGHDMEERNVDGATPVILASAHGNVDMVKMLLDNGADTSAVTYPKPDSRGTIRTPDYTNADVEYIEAWPHKTGGYNCLMTACMEGHLDVVKALIHSGVGIDEVSEAGFTALALSTIYNREDTAKTLLVMGADTSVKNVDGYTALMWASVMGYERLAYIILESGAILDDISKLNLDAVFLEFAGGHYEETPEEKDETLDGTISRSNTSFGACPHPETIRTSTGRCVHITTAVARRTMMRMLNNEVDVSKITPPKQTSATCWFFTSISMLFISDMARKNSKSIRRNMIMGIHGVYNKKPFSPEEKKTLLRFNMMIQSIVDGDGESETNNVTPNSVFRNNEEVVFQLYDHFNKSYPALRNINTGSYAAKAIRDIVNMLGTETEDSITLYGENDSSVGEEVGCTTGGQKMILVRYNENVGKIGMRRIFCNRMYVVDSVALHWEKHVVSAVTLGGEYYILDSYHEPQKMDWPEYFENGQPFTYMTGKRSKLSTFSKLSFVLYQLESNQPI